MQALSLCSLKSGSAKLASITCNIPHGSLSHCAAYLVKWLTVILCFMPNMLHFMASLVFALVTISSHTQTFHKPKVIHYTGIPTTGINCFILESDLYV